ncbi:APC family permease [Patulibacter defluvii]|uniref:APC family permease n=1 Tax=Patulibacter defluvii TaxID=3095358 RepID=UPI002A762321|nr:APC family permease [Patulibacter sp. DM4]
MGTTTVQDAADSPEPRAATAAAPPPSAATRLRAGTIGAWDLVFFVVAAAAPLTVMSGVAPLAIQFGGVGAPGGYLVAGIVMATFAVGFTAMSRHVPNAGAFYAYIGRGLGRPLGVGASLVAVLAYNAIGIGLLAATGTFAATTMRDVLHVDLPWWLWGLVAWAIVGVLGYRNITLSARVLGLFLLLEVAILGVLAVPVLLDGGREGLSFASFDPSNVFTGGVGALFVITFGAFLGFESTAIYSEEARDPRRTVRRATFASVAFLALFYTLIVWMILMAFGPAAGLDVAAKDPTGMFFTATHDWVGQGATDVMHVLIVTSALAATLAFHNASARYFHALGREGILPRALGRANAAGAPGPASLTQTGLAFAVIALFTLFGADPYMQTFLWTNGTGILGVIALQALCSVAVIGFFRRDHRDATLVQRLVAPGLAALALAATCVLIVKNFDLLTAAGTTANVLLIVPLPIAFAIGVVRALRIRRRDAAAYGRLTTVDVAEASA